MRAGYVLVGAIEETSDEQIRQQFETNVFGVINVTREALPILREQKNGHIVNIGSVLSFHVLPTSTVYSGTKGYVMNFTRGLQQEVAGTGVTVQLVLPASTATEIWELSGVPLTVLSSTDM